MNADAGPVETLIADAEAVVRPRTVGGRLFGDVGCALRTEAGNLYRGVCIDTAAGTGFCAEHAAIAAMVTAGEVRIESIVAVRNDDVCAPVVVPPCGRCREFMSQIDEGTWKRTSSPAGSESRSCEACYLFTSGRVGAAPGRPPVAGSVSCPP